MVAVCEHGPGHGSGLRGYPLVGAFCGVAAWHTRVVTGFDGRVRQTSASHSGPSGNTPLDGVSLFRNRCQGLGTITAAKA